MKDFKDKIVYITGGSQGIGLAVARQFASRGAHIIVFARRHTLLEEALKLIEERRISVHQRFSCLPVDVSKRGEVEDAMSVSVRDFGVPDVLVNCAGFARPRYFEDISYHQFDEIIHVDLYGTWNTISTLVPLMKDRGGYIVNTSSICGFIGVFGYADYCAAKFGIIGLSEVLRSELKRYNIRVSVLCPPDTDTPGFAEENKLKPAETRAISSAASLMQPDDVAVALLAGMAREDFIIIPGLNGRFTWWMKRFFPGIVESVMDADIKKIQKGQKSEK